MKILVINENANSQFMPFAMRYQIFSDWDKAVKAAKKVGWENPMWGSIDMTIGVGNLHQCGDIKVTILALDEQ